MKLMIYFCEKHLNKFIDEVKGNIEYENKIEYTGKLEQSLIICNNYNCNTISDYICVFNTNNIKQIKPKRK